MNQILNKETKMLWNGKATPVYKVLQANGLMDNNGNKTGDLTSPKNKQILNELKKSYYADAILSTREDRMQEAKELKDLANVFGETPTNIFTKSWVTVRDSQGGFKNKLVYNINLNTKTGQYLLQAKQNGIRDTFNWSDQSLSNDDADIAKFVKTDYTKTDSYKNKLKQFLDKLPENKVVTIPYTDKNIYGNLASYATGVAEVNGQDFFVQKEQALNIKDIDNDYVEIGQNLKGTEGVVAQKVRILKRDLYRAFPSLASKVDFENKQGIYTIENLKDKKIPSSPVSFVNNDKMFVYATEVLLDTKPQLIPYLKSEDAKRTIKQQNQNLIKVSPETGNLVNKVIDNSQNYSFTLEGIEGFKSDKLSLNLLDSRTGKKIYGVFADQNILGNIPLDEFMEIYNTTPQVFFGTFINEILRNQAQSIVLGQNSEAFENLVKSVETK
jgi:hypothetical protein